MMIKSLAAAGLLSVATLATPAMAQVIVQDPGVIGYTYADGPYVRGGYGYGFAAGPGYYYRNQFNPGPRVGAFATAPWDDSSYGYYGYVAPY